MTGEQGGRNNKLIMFANYVLGKYIRKRRKRVLLLAHHRHCARRLSFTMPSLRRTASSPAVRVAPYSSSLAAARGNGHRRSSGSETSTRRVLADIEWWRVTDGQCDPSSGQDNEEPHRGSLEINVLDVAATGSVVLLDVTAGLAPTAPASLPWISTDANVPSEVCVTFSICAPGVLSCLEPWERSLTVMRPLFVTIRRRHTACRPSSSLDSPLPPTRRHAGTMPCRRVHPSNRLPRPQRFAWKTSPWPCPI